MKVVYDSLVFNDEDSNYRDADGVSWMVTQIDGWDSTDLRTSTVEPTSRNGMRQTPTYLNARPMTLYGTVKAPDEERFWASWNRLDTVTNNVMAPKPLTITEEVDRTAYCVRAGAMRKAMVGVCAFTFQAPFTAYDPLKYTASVSLVIPPGSSKTITCPGSFTSERVQIQAQSNGHVALANLAWGERGLVTDIEVPNGTVFDVLNRSVTYAGQNIYGHLSSVSTWFGIQPGDNIIKNYGPTSVNLTYSPAWL